MYSQCAVCGSHWFLFCLSPYLFSEWHIVPQLYIQIKQSRVHSRKALSECKASRRLGKQIRCFYRFLSKAHPYSRFIQQPKLRIPSSPYRSNNLTFPSAEVQILPFYIPFTTLYLLQQSAFSELSSISKHFIWPDIVSKHCQQQWILPVLAEHSAKCSQVTS